MGCCRDPLIDWSCMSITEAIFQYTAATCIPYPPIIHICNIQSTLASYDTVQVVGRHRVTLLDAPFWLMFQIIATQHIIGTYEATVSSTGEVCIVQGRPAPDFEGTEWKTMYVYWEGAVDKPISSDAVLEAVTQAFLKAGIDAGWVARWHACCACACRESH